MKKITVLLTKCNDPTSTFIYFMSGWRGYTHASLGLQDKPEHYFSFNKRGFCRETLEKHRRRGVTHSCCYVLLIPDEAYYAIEAQLQLFQDNAKDYHYTTLGMMCALLQIRIKLRNAYVCSQFVAKLLQLVPNLCDKRDSCIYCPNQLDKELSGSQYLNQLVIDPV